MGELIIVTGTGSSGTSVVTRALQFCGATIALSPSKMNPASNRPYPVFECGSFHQLINRRPFNASMIHRYIEARGKMPGVQVVKHPAATRLPTVMEGWSDLPARWLICLRDFGACVESHVRYSKRQNRERCLATVRRQRDGAERIARGAGERVLGTVWFETLIDDPALELRRVVELCGLHWRDDAVSVFQKELPHGTTPAASQPVP